MKAIQISRFGGPETLLSVELPKPAPGPSEVLVKVSATGVNFADTLMRQDRYAMTPPLPAVLGMEAAGTVVRVGKGVGSVAEGDRVAAPLFAAGQFLGGYAEYVSIPAEIAIPIPDELSFEQASALLAQGLTALHLVRRSKPEGRTVLVTAAAGGVGSMLVQLARRAGAVRILAAASSAEKIGFAQSLGADAGVDYTAADWLDRVSKATEGHGPDIIYESVGGRITGDCLSALAPGGELIVYGALNIHSFHMGVEELGRLIFKNQSVTGFALVPLLTPEGLRSDLADLFGLAARGELKVMIGGTHRLEDAAEAHKAMERRTTTGKIVLVP